MIAIEWNGGLRIRRNPTCEMFLDTTWTKRCGKPATVRVTRWPYWSIFWCPDDAAGFTR